MILVTGVSGALGGLILDRLATVPGLPVVGGTRVAATARPGTVPVRRVDFDEPATLVDAFTGVDVLVFVSAGYGEDDEVLARHGAVVRAATETGVRHVIYTSLVGSGDRLTIALPHRWTEARLAEAPFEVTVLRNGLYAELLAGLALPAVDHAVAGGVFAAPWGQGRMSVVAREDLADVAARVAVEAHADLAASSGDGVAPARHAGRTYELAGVTALGGNEIAATLTDVLRTGALGDHRAGGGIRYESTSLAAARTALAGAGLPAYQVTHTLSIFSNLHAQLLEQPETDLPALLGAAPRSAPDLVADVLRSGRSHRGGTAGSR
ncbi:NAD(P)H-binding protein [Plantactinospora sp. S1510]|uniref:NAD(P)H-binding protein n=1 Tax=Plantactinospora alkalitolerans TaxID=2789879 RepID=A0ABS0H4S1_9ACTN|nr:NAD(P)H-binding protein [Plantactinospora alkalitolerans]MBF9133122.1 NAD(P)H-binding protein [Plantactinospora alkalitolerans]